MSIATVVTRGFSTGNANFVVTRGYGDFGAVATQPHGVIVRRGKTRLWTDEEAYPEKVILETRQAEVESLLGKQAFLRDQLKEAKGVALREERNKLSNELEKLNKSIKQAKVKLEQDRKEYEKAAAKARADREETEDVMAIMSIISELYH